MSEAACHAPDPAGSPVATSARHEADVAIIGGGLAGSLAAAVLGRAGHRVTLIDRHAVYPPEFRVEKLAGDEIGLLRRLGLLDCIAASANRYEQVLNVRRGRVIDRTYGEQYGILYHDLVRTVREQIPSAVDLVVGRVTDVQTGPERQCITLASDGVVDATSNTEAALLWIECLNLPEGGQRIVATLVY